MAGVDRLPQTRMQRYRIVVVGAGYVGLSIAILLAGSNDVTIVDITPEKVDSIQT